MLELWMVTFVMFPLRIKDRLMELLVIVELMIVLLRIVEFVAVDELSAVALMVLKSTVLLVRELF